MAVCARAIQQPDGSFLLGLDPSQTNLTACSYVVQSGAEIGNSPFNLSAEDGLQVSYAIIGLWAIAYAFKAIISTLKGNEDVETES